MKVAYRTLRYLRGTINTALIRKPGHDDKLRTYVDVAWGNEAERKGRSHSGKLVLFEETPIYPSSQLQKCIIPRPTEAEHVALAEAEKTIA